MIYTLSSIAKESSRKRAQKKFDASNKVLTEKEIEELRKDIRSALPIFKSAVVDHEPINGVPYHTFYPFKNLEQYSHFRRAAIAHGLYLEADKLSEEDLSTALSILETLGNSNNESAKTKILAWNALGKIGMIHPELFNKELTNLQNVLYKNHASEYSFIPANSTPLGGILFLDSLSKTEKVGEVKKLVEDAVINSESLSAKVLLTHFMNVNPSFKYGLENIPDIDSKLKEFYLDLNNNVDSFNPEAKEKGLSLCGIVQPQELPLWSGTSHKKWVDIASSVAGSYPYAIGAFAKRNYSSFARR